MSYEVIREFTDLQDNNHPYSVGDPYPRDGLEVTKDRISELAGEHNRQKQPLISEPAGKRKKTKES